MAEQPKKAKRIPLGEPLTEAELDALADIGPDDILSAENLWEAAAPKPLKKLLEAKPVEDAGG